MKVDVAIIGSGVAGLTTALSVSPKLKTAVFCKRSANDCASAMAQGGIAVALADSDTYAAHVKDTLQAGDGLCNPDAVQAVIEDSASAVSFLSENGVQFNQDAKGDIALGREGGHSARRIAHVDDATGQAVVSALAKKARCQNNIEFHERWIAVNLYVKDGNCRGFYALNLETGKIESVNARAVIIASGGAGKVYLYATTPQDSTGDGIAMAYRAGCPIANMEFVQFHPTCLYHPLSPPFLVTEALRGEGARLINGAGEFFMEHSGADELSPRDIVARAIDAEMKRSGADCVYLDLSAHPESFWKTRFPTVFSRCESLGLNAASRIPVVPAAHYCCGGVQTDMTGRAGLSGLFAVGEAASNGMHGANRLASNSLLECITTARRAAACVSEELPNPAQEMPPWDERRISASSENIMVAHNWEELRRLMWSYVGIARSDERLVRARRRIEWLGEEIEEFYQHHVVSRDFLELRNLAQCAQLIVEGALSRRESRGLHFNINCPDKAKRARDTVLCRAGFERRRQSVNSRCPFSQRPVVANSLADYRGKIVGFCNPDCRDKFAAAVQNNFKDASAAILSARKTFDAQI